MSGNAGIVCFVFALVRYYRLPANEKSSKRVGPLWRANSFDCRSEWLFRPAHCGRDGGNALKSASFQYGPFKYGAAQGAKVVVHNQPCTAAGCPSGGTVCAVLEYAPECMNRWSAFHTTYPIPILFQTKKASTHGNSPLFTLPASFTNLFLLHLQVAQP